MVKKLKVRFIVIAMLTIIIVTYSIVGIILLVNYATIEKQNDGILDLILENDGKIPEYKPRDDFLSDVITQETQFSTRYFVIRVNENGEITETEMQYIASITQEETQGIIDEILKDDKKDGYYEEYKYKISKESEETVIVFLDCSLQINNLKSLIRKSIIIATGGIVIVFIIISIISTRVIKPAVDNMERQKQFITNAGHDLKTPVAVIIADTEILEMTSDENKDNEWIQSIKSQAQRLDRLIKNLLNLANMQEKNIDMTFTEFSITKMIKEEVGEFKALAKNKKLIYDDSKEVMIKADYNSIRQLVTIFLDNAIKYTPENGVIKIVTEKVGKNTKIQFINNCKNSKNINTKKIFDRFYREDKSRSQNKEGYGIGLSMARSIVELHKGKISAEINKENMICFTVLI